YGIVETVSGYSRLYTILANNEALDNALRQVTFSESMENQIVIPIMASIVLLIFGFVAIFYTLALAIYRLSSGIIFTIYKTNNQIIIPITSIIVLLILAFVAIIYTLALAIYRLTSSIIAYKQQNNNETVRTLLKGFSNDNRSDVINAYFDMKSNDDKHKLFIS